MHQKDEEKLGVFSNIEFESEGKYEDPGKCFNPVIGAILIYYRIIELRKASCKKIE